MFQQKEEKGDVTLICKILHWYATTSVTTLSSKSSLTAFWVVIPRSPEYTVSYPKRQYSS
jgi:hypothetical protein